MPATGSHSFYIPTLHNTVIRVGEDLYNVENIRRKPSIIEKPELYINRISQVMKKDPVVTEDNESYKLQIYTDGLFTFELKIAPYSNIPIASTLYMEWMNAFIATLCFCADNSFGEPIEKPYNIKFQVSGLAPSTPSDQLLRYTLLITPLHLFQYTKEGGCGIRLFDLQTQYRMCPKYILHPFVFHRISNHYIRDSIKINIADIKKGISVFNEMLKGNKKTRSRYKKIQYLYNFIKIKNSYLMANFPETILYSSSLIEWLLKNWAVEEGIELKKDRHFLLFQNIVKELKKCQTVKKDISLKNLLSSTILIHKIRNSISHKTVLFSYPYYFDDNSKTAIQNIHFEDSDDIFTEHSKRLKKSIDEFIEHHNAKPESFESRPYSNLEYEIAWSCLNTIRYFFLKKFLPEFGDNLLNSCEKRGYFLGMQPY